MFVSFEYGIHQLLFNYLQNDVIESEGYSDEEGDLTLPLQQAALNILKEVCHSILVDLTPSPSLMNQFSFLFNICLFNHGNVLYFQIMRPRDPKGMTALH